MDVREYDLNLIPGSVPEIVKINQYDNGISFAFTIYQGEKKFSIPAGSTVLLTGTKPDGLGFTYDCTFSGSVVSVTIGDQVAVLNGKVDAEISIISGSSVRLGTANFVFLVEPAALQDDTAVSDSDFPAIVKAADHIDDAKRYADNAAQSAKDAKTSASSAASAAKNAIADEVARAKSAEAANAKATADETTRAKKAEAANTKSITDEVTRAKAAEAANAKAVAAETTRAKAAEAANTKLTNDLKTGITSGSVKAAKAGTADSASALGRVSTFWTMIPDNGGRRKYLLMFDISEWVPKTSNSGTYGFDGLFFSRRSGGYVGSNCTGNLSIVASWNGTNSDGTKIVSDNESCLRLRTTSGAYVPVVLHQKSTNKYFLTLMVNGSGRDLILFGVFQGNLIGTWIENIGSNLSNGALPSDYEEYSRGFFLMPYEKAVRDKNGKDITEYLASAAYSNGTFTFSAGNGNKTSLTIPEATTSAKGLLKASDKALIDRISKINLTRVRSMSNVAWAAENAELNQDISSLLPGKYKISAKFKIETDNSANLKCASSSWRNLISVYIGSTMITTDGPNVAVPIGTKVGYTVTNYCTFIISEANAHASNFHAYFYLAGDGTSNRPYIGTVSNIELTMVN